MSKIAKVLLFPYSYVNSKAREKNIRVYVIFYGCMCVWCVYLDCGDGLWAGAWGKWGELLSAVCAEAEGRKEAGSVTAPARRQALPSAKRLVISSRVDSSYRLSSFTACVTAERTAFP